MTGRVLWAARHAPAAVEQTCYGRTDVPTRVSHDEAGRTLAASFPGEPPAAVWASPMARCAEVARRLAARWGAPLRIDAALHELNFGAWDGLSWSAIENEHRAAYARWLEAWEEMAPPGGERPRDLEARVRAWLAGSIAEGHHVLVAHAGVVRALRVVLEGRTWPDAMAIPVGHLAWTRFASSPAGWRGESP